MTAGTTTSARSSFGLLLAGRVASAVLQSVLLVLLAREIAPVDFGVVATFLTLATVAGAVSDLGLETSLLRAAAIEADEITALSRLHRITVGAVCVLLFGVGLLLAAGPYPVLQAALPLVLWVWLERRLSLYTGLRVARSRPGLAGVSIASARLVSVVAFLALVPLFGDPVLAYSVASVLGSLVGLVLAFDSMPSGGAAADARTLLGRANPFWRASMSGLLRTLDVPIVQAISGPAAAAVYALPARAVAPLRLLATTMATTAIPYASRRDSERLRDLERLTFLGWVVMAVVLASSWLLIDDVVVLVLGEAYRGAAHVLRILAIGVMINVPGAYWSGVLQGFGEERLVARVGVWLLVIFMVFVGVGALVGGAMGAASGITLTYLVQTVIFGFRRVKGSPWWSTR